MASIVERLLPLIPWPPMSRADFLPFLCPGIHPTIEDVAAREHEGVLTIRVDNGEFQVPVEECAVEAGCHIHTLCMSWRRSILTQITKTRKNLVWSDKFLLARTLKTRATGC